MKLQRRTFLKGIGGVAMALPALEAFAQTAPIPNRFVVSFAGTSLAADGKDLSLVIPAQAGAGYASTRGLKPLFDLGVQGDVSVVSGLNVPVSANDTDPIPAGGAAPHYHGSSRTPQLCGVHNGPQYGGFGDYPTADQLVASSIAGSTVQKVLAYRVQAANYVTSGTSGQSSSGTLSYLKSSSGGIQGVSAVSSPHLAFASLFSGFVPSGTTVEQARQAAFLLTRRKSVVDLVKGNTEQLMGQLGRVDQLRMQRHLDEIRAMEVRLNQLPPPMSSSCQTPATPGADPPIAGAGYDYTNSVGTDVDLMNNGYSNEDLRADLLTDFITMAFACDLSRVANYWLTYHQSFMSMYKINGQLNNMHGLTHAGDQGGVADSTAWHVKQFAKLVKKLKDTKEVDGTSLLDHTSLALTFEGGGGAATDVGLIKPGNYAHSMYNMMVLVAGRAGGLKPGKHILGAARNPAFAVFSSMKAAGYTGATYGEVNGTIPELFTA